MNKTKIGIFLSLLLLIGLTSCGEQKSNNKLVLNEILIDNQSNFQDDYGLHSAWIEILSLIHILILIDSACFHFFEHYFTVHVASSTVRMSNHHYFLYPQLKNSYK